MKNNSVFIEHWCYTKPDLVPKQNGNIVIIKKVSFGPLEVYEMIFMKVRIIEEILQEKNCLIKFFQLFLFLKGMDYLNG